MNNDKRSTHIDFSQGRDQFRQKCLPVGAFRLGIHRGSNKPINVEFGLDKIWVLG
jgi:hypothetical protein